MRIDLQTKLTFSHLLVTVLSVTILAGLIAGGYLVYLNSDLPALWAADTASILGDEMTLLAKQGLLSPTTVREIIASSELVPIFDVLTPDQANFFFEEWLVIIDVQGHILTSNDERRFPQGSQLPPLPGISPQDLTPGQYKYTVLGQDHIGLVAFVDGDENTIGWVYYYYAGEVTEIFSSGQTLAVLGGGILVAALIATVISGISGGVLARSFGRRLRQLQAASAAIASGDLGQRVATQGHDEIDQLAQQFNRMAEQLADQLRQLRLLAERNALLAEEASALATLEERNRIARELHDALKQQIFGLSLTAGTIRQLALQDPERAIERLAQLEQQARDVHQEIDAIIKQMRPASLDDRGLPQALHRLTEKWQDQHGIPTPLTIQGEHPLPLAIEHALFRIAQESLNNVAQHARATHVEISLRYTPQKVTLEIVDNGAGFDTSQPASTTQLGLSSMDARARELGGSLSIDSQSDGGTRVRVVLPTETEGTPND